MAENRRDNVDNELMAYLYAGPYSLIAEQDGTARYGWELLDEPHGRTTGNLRGEHETIAAAHAAGIAWIRRHRPDLVRLATQQAQEGEAYRARQHRA